MKDGTHTVLSATHCSPCLLPPFAGHKLKILNVLIGQILTYASLRDAIDDNIEELKKEKNGLRLHQQTVGRYEKEIQAARYHPIPLLSLCLFVYLYLMVEFGVWCVVLTFSMVLRIYYHHLLLGNV